MADPKIFKLNGYTNLVVSVILIGGALMAFGVLFYQVAESKTDNTEQDRSIATLKTDMAVIRATTTRTEEDVSELLRIQREK